MDIPTGTEALEPARPSVPEDATVPPQPAAFREDATVPPQPPVPVDATFEPAARNGAVDEEKARDSLKAEANYQVEGEIARGGMGAIMRAVDQDIRREVAVKFLLNHADAKMKARFVEEAQITGQLEHPNIVPIHQLGVHPDGRCFFSMKMVKGRSLADILKEPRKDDTLGRLLNIFVSICNAMAYAHSREVIHRDLKPANIMVGDFGEVYVMDWGLAKVLGKDDPPDASASAIPIQPKNAWADLTQPGSPADSKSGDKVTTSRHSVGELTQAGAIMGTPAYMPPEQAQGGNVDQRAEIYSLGAILYEILTLTPPVGRGGDMLAIVMRVVEGQIDPPQTRSPERAKGGWIPAELSAIAMKALATDPAKRYQTVEKLRRDVELFLEGRSVSAKQDSFREMAWKLIKRNKGASLTAAAALVVLTVLAGFFLKINYDARVVAETERGKAQEAYQAYQKQVKDSVPAFLGAAKMFINDRKFDLALVQASLAAKSAPDSAEARLLKGELLITRQRFAEALPELEEYRKLKGQDADVRKLTELCRKAQPEDPAALLVFAEVFTKRQEHALADGVLSGQGKNAVEARQRLLKIYQQRLDAAWPPGWAGREGLSVSVEGRFSLTAYGAYLKNKVTDLTPLKGMPLAAIALHHHDQIRDLAPLRGMPLTSLDLSFCGQIQDLGPLQDLPLTSLNLFGTGVRDLRPLKGLSLTTLDLSGIPITDLEPLRGMPLTTLNLDGCRSIRDLKPLQGMQLTELNIVYTGVSDLAPLQGMPLTMLLAGHCPVQNLAPLQGLPLTSLDLTATPVRDLGPLQGVPLTSLNLLGTQVSDLGPLQGMPLTSLNLSGTQVSDLGPLQGMPLTTLHLGGCGQIQNLERLKGMPLTSLSVIGTPVRDLKPLKGMPLKLLTISGSAVTDLNPLQGMKLEDIRLTPKNISQGLDILRDMKSLGRIGIGGTYTEVWPAAEFWKKYDAGEFKK